MSAPNTLITNPSSTIDNDGTDLQDDRNRIFNILYERFKIREEEAEPLQAFKNAVEASEIPDMTPAGFEFTHQFSGQQLVSALTFVRRNANIQDLNSVLDSEQLKENIKTLNSLATTYKECDDALAKSYKEDLDTSSAASMGSATQRLSTGEVVEMLMLAIEDDFVTNGITCVVPAALLGLLHRSNMATLNTVLFFLNHFVLVQDFRARHILVIHVLLRTMQGATTTSTEDRKGLEAVVDRLVNFVLPGFQHSAAPLADKVVFTPLLKNAATMLSECLDAFKICVDELSDDE